ncbi:VOC family protein [Porticoccus sp. GXU_MW_L64]
MSRLLTLIYFLFFSLSIQAESVTGVTQVDHVGLAVKDLEATKNLFTQVLGFKVGGHNPDYPSYSLSNGHAKITLWRVTDPATATPFNRKTNVGLHHLALSVESEEQLHALYKKVKAFPGVRIDFAPELFYGGPSKHMMFFEPSGNRIELLHRTK